MGGPRSGNALAAAGWFFGSLPARRGFAPAVLPLTDLQERRRAPVVTSLLLAVNVGVFVYELWLAHESTAALHRFVLTHAFVPAEWVAAWDRPVSWLPVLTAMSLHGSLAQVVGNGWFLWVFGRTVEDRIGHTRYLILYLTAGFLATVVQVAVNPTSTVPLLGASGAISGVLGAYLLLRPAGWVLTLVPWIVPLVPLPAVVFLVLWFALQLTQGFGSILNPGSGEAGGVAWWAHIGGFLAGVAGVPWLRPGRRRRRKR
jgi:membrane associated rhomboid family serine protease